MEKHDQIIKVANKGTGKIIEVGVDGVTKIEAVGTLFIAYVHRKGEEILDTCTIDPEYAWVEMD